MMHPSGRAIAADRDIDDDENDGGISPSRRTATGPTATTTAAPRRGAIAGGNAIRAPASRTRAKFASLEIEYPRASSGGGNGNGPSPQPQQPYRGIPEDDDDSGDAHRDGIDPGDGDGDGGDGVVAGDYDHATAPELSRWQRLQRAWYQHTRTVWTLYERAKQRRPYLPLYVGAGTVVLLSFVCILYSRGGEDLSSYTKLPMDAADFSSCTKFTPKELQKFLDHIDRLPDPVRCNQNPLPPYARGKTNVCHCMNPLQPQPAPETNPINGNEWGAQWSITFERNLETVRHNAQRDLDVVLVGDSITEHWHGTSLGNPKMAYLQNKMIYKEYFLDQTSHSVNGLALGISGDRCSQLLYRLQNGEMGRSAETETSEDDTNKDGESPPKAPVPELKPYVWWVLIGTNDVATGDFCRPESVVAGNIRIAQEIRERRPNATVVLQSLLPVLDLNHLKSNDNNQNKKKGKQQQQPSDKEKDGEDAAYPLYWDVYKEINEALACYADNMPENTVRFYNATPLFFNDDQRTVNVSMLPDGIHPTAKASKVLAAAMEREIVRIIVSRGGRGPH